MTNNSCDVNCSNELHPNMNYQLLIDDVEFEFFRSFGINQSLSALSQFNFDVSNPNGERNSRFQFNSEVEFKASWGSGPLQSLFSGFIKQRDPSIGLARSIRISGVDFGDFMIRKKPWDENKNPIVYDNQKVSSILADLVGLSPGIKLQISKISNEPRLDYTTDPTNDSVLDAFKTVAEYGGYEWLVVGDKIVAREPKTLESDSASYNLIVGQQDGSLPELPFVWLYGASMQEDAGSIRNVYKVDGSTIDGVLQTSLAKNARSIQEFKGEFEGYYGDPNLTSVQSCYVVAKRLTEINGVPRTSIGVGHRGVLGFNSGDIVGLGDENGGFDFLTNPFVRVVSMDHSFGQTWTTSCQLGSQRRKLSDLF